jgi:peptide deformylase
MPLRDLIITLPDPHLREKSKKIVVIDAKLQEVIDNMKAATLDWEASRPHELGVALAAVQIDQPYRIIVIRSNFEDKGNQSFRVFINPEITKKEGLLEEDFEGCLSVLDIYGKLPRYDKIRLKALNEDGATIRIKAQGFLARVIQHEVDHINGIMFVDHIKDRHDAFYKLAEDGKLISMPYEEIEKTHIFHT